MTAVAQVVQEKVHEAPRANLPPVDQSVVLPEAVRRAADRANNYYSKPAEQADAPAPAAGDAATVLVPTAAEPAPAAAVTAAGNEPAHEEAPAPVVDDQSWEHKFKSQQGRVVAQNTQIRAMQEQMNELGQELVNTQRRLEQVQQTPRAAAPQSLVTDTERAEYGNEFIDVAQRAALEKINPTVDGLVQEVTTLKNTLQKQATAGLYTVLTQAVPNWRAINNNSNFLSWLGLRDPISGVIRRVLLDGAFRAADAARVVAIFQGFATAEAAQRPAETAATELPAPVLPAPTRQPVVSLETLAAPGRARSAPTTVAAEKPIYTTAQISQFYNDVRRGAYAGRDADKNAIEQDIFAAQREARVRG